MDRRNMECITDLCGCVIADRFNFGAGLQVWRRSAGVLVMLSD